MAVRIDAAADSLQRSANLPASDAWTIAFWVYISVDRNASGSLAVLFNGTGTVYSGIGLSTDGTTLRLLSNLGLTTGTNLAATTWHHIALVCDGTAITGYLNGVSDATNGHGQSFTPAALVVGSDTVNWVDGRVAALKLWDAALTAAEVAQEMHTIRPQRAANLNLWWPTFPGATERGLDYSGNGRNATQNGTLADEDGPPVSYGAPNWYVVGQPASAPPANLRRYSLTLLGVN